MAGFPNGGGISSFFDHLDFKLQLLDHFLVVDAHVYSLPASLLRSERNAFCWAPSFPALGLQTMLRLTAFERYSARSQRALKPEELLSKTEQSRQSNPYVLFLG